MAKRRVLEHGMQRRGFVTIDDEATKGAVLGKNLYNADGTLFDAGEVITQAIRTNTTTTTTSIVSSIWRLILEIPANIISLAALTGIGFATRINSSSDWANRVIQGITGRIDVVSGDGVGNVNVTLNSGGSVMLNSGGNVTLNTLGGGDPTIDLAILTDSGVGASPLMLFTRDIWGRISGSQLAVWKDLPFPGYVEKTGNYTLTDSDYTVDCTANSFTLTLPTAVGIKGKIYNMKNSGSGTIIADPDGTETIDGSLTIPIFAGENRTIQSTGSNWIII